MDASEKIIRFDSYEAMLEEIKRDMVDGEPLRCRYPVRFIMLNNFNVWHKLAQDLAVLGAQPMNLEELIKDCPERWITADELVRYIRGCRTTSVVSPFSELIRFYPDVDFRGLFNEVMLIEDIDYPRKRIYIPLIGLQNRFGNFLNSFARIEESAPVWSYLNEEQKTKVYLTSVKNETATFAGNGNIRCLDTLFDWLRFWKTHAPQDRIICSSGPINRREMSDSDNIFTFEHINNSHEYIESFLGITMPFEYNESEEKYWSLLLADIMKHGPDTFNFSGFVSVHFGFSNDIVQDLFNRWASADTSAYDRWLLKNYFLSSTDMENRQYLKVCLDEISVHETCGELFSKIAERIFYFSESSMQMKNSEERESLMKRASDLFNKFTGEETKNYIKSRISEIEQKDVQLAIALTTGVFDFEKVFLVAWYADRVHTGLQLGRAADKYPGLGMYLSNCRPSKNEIDNWGLDYIDAYREAKLVDTITHEISSFLLERNHDVDSFYRWYYSFSESHDLLRGHQTSDDLCPDKTYWIDALGAEFLPYLLEFFKENGRGYRVVYSELARCTIPSATAQNRFSDVEKFSDLDKIAHDNGGYRKNITLVKELKAMADMMTRIVNGNVHGEHTIAIVSDHGLSCLSRLADSRKYDEKVEHDGRYIRIVGQGKKCHNSDYVVHDNENDGERYKVALTHSSLGRKPVHEVHGGCTPEEVLVPYVIITNRRQSQIIYKCELITKEIDLSDPVVSVSVMPQPTMVTLDIDGQKHPMARDGSTWSARVDGLREGALSVEFIFPDGTSFNATIQVNGTGLTGNDFLDF